MTTLPAAKATSVTASSFWEGSITRPPRRTKSKGIVVSECDSEGSGGSASVAQDHALPRLANKIEHGLDDPRAITAPLDRPELGGINGENAAHASIFLGKEHLDVSLGRVALRKAGAHEPTMPDVSKFRTTKPRIEDADMHVCFVRLGDLRTATNATDRSGPESWIVAVKYQIADAGIPISICGTASTSSRV